MTASHLIAGYAGPLFIALAAAMLLNRAILVDAFRELSDSPGLVVFAGILALVAGLAIVRAHNLWVADWRIGVTLLGWLSIAGGIVRILSPDRVAALSASMLGSDRAYTFWALVTLALGAFFTIKGYALL